MRRYTVGLEVELDADTTCPECGGSWGYCNACMGERKHACPECDGEGKVAAETCPVCEGQGWFACFECDGKGFATCECGFTEGRMSAIADVLGWAEEYHPEHCGAEFSGKVFSRATLDEITRQVDALARQVAKTAKEYAKLRRRDIALHVHISAQNGDADRWDEEQVSRIVKVWKVVQGFAIELAQPHPERIGEWCQPNGQDYPETRRGVGRAHMLNAWCAWCKHGTVEFRLWNMSGDWRYIRNALLFSLAVCEVAMRLDSFASPVDIYNTLAEILPGELATLLRQHVAAA